MPVPVPGALYRVLCVLATSRELLLLHVPRCPQTVVVAAAAAAARCQEPLTVRFAALTWPDKS